MKSRTINVSEDGALTFLDQDDMTDTFRGEGTIQMTRASHIDWNEERQEWEVLTPDKSEVLYRHKYRKDCLEWEQENLQP